MIDRIIDFSVENKLIIFILTAVACIWGWWSMQRVPLDAIPDLSETQVRAYVIADNKLAGKAGWDEELAVAGSVVGDQYRALFDYFAQGGVANLTRALRYCSFLIGSNPEPEEAEDLATAVRLARGIARSGGTVLLSPGAPSFPRFRDYRDRGRQFAACCGFDLVDPDPF